MNSPAPALLLRFFVGVLLLAVGPQLAFDALRFVGFGADAAGSPAHVEHSLTAALLASVAVVGFARWQPPAWPWRPLQLLAVLRSWAWFLPLWVLLLLGYLASASALGAPVAAQLPLRYLADGDPARPGFWLVTAAIVVGAPCAEEIVFRGYLQGALQGVLRPPLAITIAALLFGLVHSLPYALPVGVLGAMFGWLAARHGGLWPAVAAHALHNGLTVLVTFCWPATLDFLYPR